MCARVSMTAFACTTHCVVRPFVLNDPEEQRPQQPSAEVAATQCRIYLFGHQVTLFTKYKWVNKFVSMTLVQGHIDSLLSHTVHADM